MDAEPRRRSEANKMPRPADTFDEAEPLGRAASSSRYREQTIMLSRPGWSNSPARTPARYFCHSTSV